jgi:hypothetical protein
MRRMVTAFLRNLAKAEPGFVPPILAKLVAALPTVAIGSPNWNWYVGKDTADSTDG